MSEHIKRDFFLGATGIAAGCMMGLYISQNDIINIPESLRNALGEVYNEIALLCSRSMSKIQSTKVASESGTQGTSESDSKNASDDSGKGSSLTFSTKPGQAKSSVLGGYTTDTDTNSTWYDNIESTLCSIPGSTNALANFPEITHNRTLMARHLSPQLYEQYFRVKTSFGTTIDDCIQAGIDNQEKVSCGVIACDEECYDVFDELFDPVITDRHRGFMRNDMGSPRKLNFDKSKIQHLDNEYVKSMHFLIGRCLQGFRFPPTCTRSERHRVESVLKMTLQSLTGQFAGEYLHLSQMTPKDLAMLPDILQSVAECPTSSTLRASGSTRDWPSARGIFYSRDRKLYAWTNREDHLRVMYRVREKGTPLNFSDSYKTFCRAMKKVEHVLHVNGIQFARHDSYGYLLTCPSGIGTALRAGAHMKLPLLLNDKRLRCILKNLRLHMGTDDQDLFHKGYVDVYNMDRLGFQEEDLVHHVAASVSLLVEMEKALEQGREIDDLIKSCEMVVDNNMPSVDQEKN